MKKRKTRVKSISKVPASTTRKRVIAFPPVEGKTMESIKFHSADPEHSIILNFTDRTCLTLDIMPEFHLTLMADHADWATGNYRPIRRWWRLPVWD